MKISKEQGIVKKVSVIDTLMAIPIGGMVVIKKTEAKPTTVRAMAYRLKSRGYAFESKWKGWCECMEVTRIS
jgi:hypothetical protein